MLKILTENDHLMLKFISWIDLSVEYKLWNATLLLTPVLINFTQRIFPNEIPEKLASWAVGIFAVMLLVILFLPL